MSVTQKKPRTRYESPRIKKCENCGTEIFTYDSYPICNKCFEEEKKK